MADNDAQFSRIEAALRLVQRVLPTRYHQIVRDLRYVWVRRMPSYAKYDHATGACLIGSSVFSGGYGRPEDIARILVHEATHARLSKLGYGYDEAIRARIEVVCHRRELAFAKRLGDERAIWAAEYFLKNPIDYSDEAVRSRSESEFRLFAVNIGIPAWLAEFVIRMRRRRDERRRRFR